MIGHAMTLAAEAPPVQHSLLHVGCGMPDPGKLPAGFFAQLHEHLAEWSSAHADP